jgi:hypothetical protein
VCASLPPDRKAAIYDAAKVQSVVAARTVNEGIGRLIDDLTRQNKDLQAYIDAHMPPGSKAISPVVVALTDIPATVKAAADFTSLFKTDVIATGLAYGDGARDMFVTALSQSCPERIAGRGSGYLGELDASQQERLHARVRALAAQRSEFADRIEIVQRLADVAKGDEKREFPAVEKCGVGAVEERGRVRRFAQGGRGE